MLGGTVPLTMDNTYRGHKLGLWLFAAIVGVKILQSLSVMFNGAAIITAADGIPLDSFTPAAAQTVLAIWVLSALDRLIVYSICVFVLVRYRSAITLMFALLAVHYLAREAVMHFVPIARTGAPIGPLVNAVLFILTIVGLALSVWKGNQPVPRGGGEGADARSGGN